MSADGNVPAMMRAGDSGWVPRGLLGPTSQMLQRMCRESGWKFYLLDLGGVEGKDTLMQTLKDRLDLPDYFGRNWDALADCLYDLGEGADGVIVRLKGVSSLEQQLAETLCDVLDERIDADAKAFIVVADTPLPRPMQEPNRPTGEM